MNKIYNNGDNGLIWKDIHGYEGLYQINTCGDIKSLAGGKDKILKKRYDHDGYCQACLSNNGKHKYYKVHRLVWEVFVGPIPEGMHINHINEVKDDNRLDNLNLMTPTENNNWATHNERMAMSNKNGKCSKKVFQYDLENNFIKEWPSLNEVERQTGISAANISRCCTGKRNTSMGFKWRYAS